MNSQYSDEIQDIDELVSWEIILDTLSVERVERFLPEMGLYFLDAGVIRSLARQFVKQIEEADDDLEKRKILLRQVFIKLQEETNTDVSQKLYQWGKWICISKRKEGLFFWSLLLPWLGGSHGTHVPVVKPPLDQKKLDAIIQTIRDKFADNQKLKQEFEDAEELPKSKWEEYIYHKSEEGYSPLTFAHNSIIDHKVQQIWDLIHSLLSKTELAIFLKWAKEIAPSLQLNSELIRLPASFP